MTDSLIIERSHYSYFGTIGAQGIAYVLTAEESGICLRDGWAPFNREPGGFQPRAGNTRLD